jgi:hypothetical protein
MKKIFALTAVFCLLAVAAMAQKKADFSGTWTLDVAKSQLGERSRVESMTMTVTQTDKNLKVSTETKRQAPPADAAGGGRPGGGGGFGRGGFGGGDGTVDYSLDGKDTTVEVEGPNGKMPVKYKGSMDGGKANLSSSRSFSGPNGDVSITTKETWSLSEDGKTLTVVRETASPRGTNSSTMVFVKK